MRKTIWLLCLALSVSCAALADDDEGHHHEELTQEQLGTVNFPVSCTPDAQNTFQRGVALLHSFWYEEAEKTFLEVEKQDPNCAMAHWGVAMSLWHQLWDQPDAATIKRASAELKKTGKPKAATQRERDYIAAVTVFYSDSGKLDHDTRAKAYSDAMQKVYQRYPDDHEAAAFYALSLLASEPDGDTTFANRKQAGAILDIFLQDHTDSQRRNRYLTHVHLYVVELYICHHVDDFPFELCRSLPKVNDSLVIRQPPEFEVVEGHGANRVAQR